MDLLKMISCVAQTETRHQRIQQQLLTAHQPWQPVKSHSGIPDQLKCKSASSSPVPVTTEANEFAEQQCLLTYNESCFCDHKSEILQTHPRGTSGIVKLAFCRLRATKSYTSTRQLQFQQILKSYSILYKRLCQRLLLMLVCTIPTKKRNSNTAVLESNLYKARLCNNFI